MKRLFLLGSLLVAISLPVAAHATKLCNDDSVDTVSEDGTIVKMLSGHVYEISGGDEIDSALWLPAEGVLVCSQNFQYQGKQVTLYTIINTDDDGEKVDAERLR